MAKITEYLEYFFYDLCWYMTKAYTYITEYVCCYTKKYNTFRGDGDDSVSNTDSDDSTLSGDSVVCNSDNFDYCFLLIEIKVNDKTYLLEDYKQDMHEDAHFLTKDYVYNFLKSKKVINDSSSPVPEPDYKIVLMDNKSKLVTLDKTKCLLLMKENYEIINSEESESGGEDN